MSKRLNFSENEKKIIKSTILANSGFSNSEILEGLKVAEKMAIMSAGFHREIRYADVETMTKLSQMTVLR